MFLLCSFFVIFLTNPRLTHAASFVPPQPPFSEEGNPDGEYFFGSMFTLLTYIRAPALEVYENMERTRSYENLWVYPPGDRRDYYCDDQGDDCEGGDVDLVIFGTTQVARTATSGPGKCKLGRQKTPDGPIVGKCDYSQLPRMKSDIKGTDFSNADQTVFDKIQSKSGAYNNVGTDNAITWGSQHLSSSLEQKIINQVLVVRRAKQTKATLGETGEWPLGWVDWGYKTPNGKTLIEINEELPESIANAAGGLVEGVDDFFLNAGNLEAVSDVSGEKTAILSAVADAMSEDPQPVWLTDLMQAPMYSPSWRQAYVRPSICVWKICRPGTRGGIIPQPIGFKRALYYDNSISQAFGAALDNMLTSYSYESGAALFKELAIKNPLIRFTTSASVNATPSKIIERLNREIVKDDPCLKYHAGMSFLAFGQFMDYVLPGDYFDAAEKCPVYQIAPEMSKQNAAAFYQSALQALIAMIWGQRQDEVDSVVYHLLTIPDAMAQSIQEIQQTVYDTRDTLAELESVKDFNANLSNTVDDNAGYLYGGETPFDPRRRLGYYTCSDEMFSSQLDTDIQAYAMGTRVGCDASKTASASATICDGSKFAKIIADSPWKAPLPAATQVVLNSAMFVGGKLNPELEKVYAAIEKKTGVPCEVLAGHHFEEASAWFTDLGNPETRSAADGGPVSEQGGLEATVNSAANSVLRYPIGNTAKLIASMSNFNGGGNSNCQLGYPFAIPYSGCPRKFIGEDDPYVTNMIDARHASMYLLYHADFTASAPTPYGTDRPGAFAVALAVYNEYTSKNTPSASPGSSPVATTTGSAPSTGSSLDPTGNCGDGYIDTALGCLPYDRTGFIMALLRFVVGISGGIALVVMLSGTIQIMTAGGDAKKLQSGRDLFTAAIAGLLFLIFSAAILRIFGTDILKLPGF